MQSHVEKPEELNFCWKDLINKTNDGLKMKNFLQSTNWLNFLQKICSIARNGKTMCPFGYGEFRKATLYTDACNDCKLALLLIDSCYYVFCRYYYEKCPEVVSDKKTVYVGIALYLMNLHSVDLKSGTFHADFYLYFKGIISNKFLSTSVST